MKSISLAELPQHKNVINLGIKKEHLQDKLQNFTIEKSNIWKWNLYYINKNNNKDSVNTKEIIWMLYWNDSF